jgi:hypothetical protein
VVASVAPIAGGEIEEEMKPPTPAADDAATEQAEATVSDLSFHPIADIFPRLEGPEFDALKEDIQAHGLREPLWLHDGQVVDGRNRYRACQELGITPPTREWDGKGSLVDFVLGQNLHRRHLSETQRAMIGARLKQLFEQDARNRMRAGKPIDPGAILPQGQGRAREHAAKMVSVSPRTVDAATRVQRDGCADLIHAVEADKISVWAASKIAALPKKKQADVVKQGGRQNKAKAKEARKHQSQAGSRRDAKRGRQEDAADRSDLMVEQSAASPTIVTLTLPVTAKGLVAALLTHLQREEVDQLLREASALMIAAVGGADTATQGGEAA